MKKRILQNGRLLASLEAQLAAEFDLHALWKEADPKAYLAAHGDEFAGLVTSAKAGADSALIAALPSLQVISSFGVGYDTIDLRAAAQRNIAVGYTPNVLNDCVADLGMGLLIDVARGVSAADRFIRAGRWMGGQQLPLATRVSGKRLGILGLGRIGRTIARRAGGFDMQIRYHSRRPVSDATWGYASSPVALAEWADFLMVACAGGPATRHLVSAEVINAIGPKGFLINISRGSVVDEPALVEALATGKIAGAALDVFDGEPHVPVELMKMDNVVLSAHIASQTHETRQAMAALVISNLRSFFAHGWVEASVLQ
jgi:hydroxypyruvate reductase